MFRRSDVPADKVHEALRQHMLVDGYPIVVDMERSTKSWVRDLVSGKEYLDFFSFFFLRYGMTIQMSHRCFQRMCHPFVQLAG